MRIKLRKFKISDVEDYFQCHQDKETKKNFMTTPKSLQEAKREVKLYISDYRKKRPFGEAFVIGVEDQFAGVVSVHDIKKNHKAVLGFCVCKEFRGRGIETRAIKLITNYAFRKYNLRRIEGRCRTFNKSSAKVMEKAGYKFEGTLRKNKLKDGKYSDDYLYARVR